MVSKEKELQELDDFYNNALLLGETRIVYKDFEISKTKDGLWRLDRFIPNMDKKIKELNIPSFIKVIGCGAFIFSYFKSVTIPEGIIKIEDMAFNGAKIRELSLPSTLMEIGNMAFSSCHIKELYIPDSVKSIGSHAFADNFCMKTVSIPCGIFVGDLAFTRCGKDVGEKNARLEIRNGEKIKLGHSPFLYSIFNKMNYFVS